MYIIMPPNVKLNPTPNCVRSANEIALLTQENEEEEGKQQHELRLSYVSRQ